MAYLRASVRWDDEAVAINIFDGYTFEIVFDELSSKKLHNSPATSVSGTGVFCFFLDPLTSGEGRPESRRTTNSDPKDSPGSGRSK